MHLYFPEANATFVHIPKTGGTSFDEWVMENVPNYQSDDVLLGHCNINVIKTRWPNLGFIFSLVRNPYDRLVSQFFYMDQSVRRRFEFRKTRPSHAPAWIFEDRYIMDDIRLLALCNKGFDYWVKSMYNSDPELLKIGQHYDVSTRANVTLWPITQCSYFCDTVPDLIIKIENVQQEFHKIQELLTRGQCVKPIAHAHKTAHDTYRSYYTSETQQMVSEMYIADLETYQYQF